MSSSAEGSRWSRFWGTLIVPLEGTVDAPRVGWRLGPLPLDLSGGLRTDTAARETYFDRRASRAVDAAGCRWHRPVESSAPATGTPRVEAYELLAAEVGPPNLVIHWSAMANPVASVAPLLGVKRVHADQSLPIEDSFLADLTLRVAKGQVGSTR